MCGRGVKGKWTNRHVAGAVHTEASSTGMADSTDLRAACPRPGWGLASTLQSTPHVEMALEGPF